MSTRMKHSLCFTEPEASETSLIKITKFYHYWALEAPEIMQGGSFDGYKGDVWALGVVLNIVFGYLIGQDEETGDYQAHQLLKDQVR